uniref:Transporter n=1 Tax=Macrostomum lignano TaxID=282301 RepID=A0A1I8HNG9_9PLAT
MSEHTEEMDEATMLIRQERPAATAYTGCIKLLNLALLLIICALERCTFYEYVADVMNSRPNHSQALDYCGILGDNNYNIENLFESWKDQTLLGLAFLLPVLGGVAADWHCGCLRVLQTGFTVYSLGAMLIVSMIYVPSACNATCKFICQAALALGSGLVRPSLMTLTYEIGQPMMGTIGVCHLYYAFEAIGEVIGCFLAYATDLREEPLTLSCVCSTYTMICLTIALTHTVRARLESRPSSPALLAANSAHPHRDLADHSDLMTNRDLLLLVWSVSLLLFVAAQALAVRYSPTFKSRFFRIALGIAVAAGNMFIESGIIFYLKSVEKSHTNPPDIRTLRYIFGSQSVIGAASEALIFVSVNEIAFKIAPAEIRTFMIGLFMSLRGSGFFTTVIILLGYQAATNEQEIFHGLGTAYMRLALGIALLLALLFFKFSSKNALRFLQSGIEVMTKRQSGKEQSLPAVKDEDEASQFVDSNQVATGTKPREFWPHHTDFVLSCVGYAVGFGSIWRFPYLCYKNGGGAFLIPYIICMVVCGVPLFYMELAIAQFSGASPLALWEIFPLLKGVGWGMIVISGLVCIYYNIILTWVIYYLARSFAARVPWSTCSNWWNTCNCTETEALYFGNFTDANATDGREFAWPGNTRCNLTGPIAVNLSQTASDEFWRYNALQQSSGITDLGGIHWGLFFSLAFAWLIIFACVFKGVKSVGKVVYFTATSPYVFLFILLVRNAMLPGSWRVVFFSLGPAWGGLITMASFNKFKNNCYRDSIITNKEVEDVVAKGPGLVFVVYPEAIAQMPLAPLWAVLFS